MSQNTPNIPNIRITKTSELKSLPDPNNLGFGQYFTDHIFCVDYSKEIGWHDARIIPYQDFKIDPGASVLHYGQALFEGMKAFKQKDGGIVLFRPEYNCDRLARGAERLCMMAPPKELMLEGIRQLVRLDARWVPEKKASSLYIRPTLIGTEAFLGVRPSEKFLFYVILSPVGAYYSGGLTPIKIWVEENYVRAAPGGLGATKAGANYAASLLAASEAKKKGYAQVLWLDTTHQFIEEVGTMNVFFVINDEVITPALNGSILDGGVRDITITILKSWGLKVTERKVSVKEIQAAHKEGTLKEAFGTGTAAVVSPIGELFYQNKPMIMNDNKIGEISQKLYNQITQVQYGEQPDTFGWTAKL